MFETIYVVGYIISLIGSIVYLIIDDAFWDFTSGVLLSILAAIMCFFWPLGAALGIILGIVFGLVFLVRFLFKKYILNRYWRF